jgi:uncharacterized RDD family membrane protein YckC
MTDDQGRVPEPPLAPPSPQMADPNVQLPEPMAPEPMAPEPMAPGGLAPTPETPEAPTAPAPAPPAPMPAAPPPAGPTYTWDQPTEPTGPAPGVRFAAHPARLVAYIVDAIILTVIAGVVFVFSSLFLALGVTTDSEGTATVSTFSALAFLVGLLIVLVVTVVYFPLFWARSGSTPGMMLFGLRVVRDRDGGPISGGTALVRYLGFILLSFTSIIGLIGFGWILVDSRRRGWHDLLAGTCVIQRA